MIKSAHQLVLTSSACLGRHFAGWQRCRVAAPHPPVFCSGYTPTNIAPDIAESADAVIVVTGLTAEDEGEGLIGAGDRHDLELPAERVQLIRDAAASNDRTIVILEGGSAITMGEWLPDIEALLMVWYPGQMGGYAIADLLFGRANPSGKLPITFNRATW